MKKLSLLATATLFLILSACSPAAPAAAPAPAAPAAPAQAAAPAPAAPAAPAAPESDFNASRQINVISREEGSGTRDAFVELLEIEVDGVDHTSLEADIAQGTSVVIATVAGNTYAIGYISLGSLNDTVQAVAIDGVSASPATVQNGTYPVFRAFNLAVGDLSDVAQDFLDFVLSAEGQEIVAGRGYITVGANPPAFTGGDVSGTVVVTGSTSIAGVMERLAEAYVALNPDANVEVHSSGSGAGITAARDGTADIGMASRELRDTELEYVASVTMAFDGIAIIINNDNPVESLSSEEVRRIFIGELTTWSEVHE